MVVNYKSVADQNDTGALYFLCGVLIMKMDINRKINDGICYNYIRVATG
jgi:hypothetical protein